MTTIDRSRLDDAHSRVGTAVDCMRSRALSGIVLAALAIRCVYALHGPIGDFAWIDGEYYLSVARNLNASFCYCNSEGEFPYFAKIADIGPTAFSVPAYPAFLAIVISLFSDSATAIYLAQALLGTCAVWLCYGSASLLAGRQVGLLAAMIHAFNPFQVFQVAIVASEGFAAFMLLLVVYVTLRWQAAMEKRSTSSPVIATVFVALALGVGILTRSAFSPIALITLLYMARIAHRATKSPWRAAGWVSAVAVGCLLLVGPWLLRNHRLWDQWMLESKIGLNLNSGFHDLADASPSRESFAPILRQDESLRALNEVQRDRVHKATALAWMKDHPLRTAWLMAKKAVMFWNPLPGQGEGILFFVALGWSLALISGTLSGLLIGLRDFDRLKYLYGVLAMYIVPHLLAYVTTRYRIPLEGLFAIFAAHGVLYLSHARSMTVQSASVLELN